MDNWIHEQEENGGIDEAVLEEIYFLRDHPLNINTATKEDLERIPCLESIQIEDILYYLYQNGPMETLSELQLIESLDFVTCRFLRNFLYVDDKPVEKLPFSMKSLLKHADRMFITKLDIPLYQRDGYKNYSDSILLKTPDKKYLGNALSHQIKYQYDYRNQIYWGFQASKDAGEPFGNNLNALYDSYSFHLMRKDWGVMNIGVLGDYKLRIGEGLLFNQGFSMGKDLSFSMKNQVINRSSSSDEYNFLRGGAASFQWGNWQMASFLSYRKLDASLNESGEIESLKTDGFHRTWTEYFRKRNVSSFLYGGRVGWNNVSSRWGVSGYQQLWSNPFTTGDALYKRYYPEGERFWGFSTDYALRFHQFYLGGELAYGNSHNGWAAVQKIMYRPRSFLTLSALYRFFSYKYYAPYAMAFSEGSRTQNESGLYFQVEALPWRFLKLKGSFDYYYFPWPKYGLSQTSDGYNLVFLADLSCQEQWRYYLQYSYKKKMKFDEIHRTHRYRFKVSFLPSEKTVCQFQLSGVTARKGDGTWVHGFLVAPSFSTVINKVLKTTITCGYIYADGSLASLSLYESGLLYTFSFQNFYDPVCRFSGTLRWDVNSHYMLMLKYGMSKYFGVTSISTGRQKIDGSMKQDLSLQLRIKY